MPMVLLVLVLLRFLSKTALGRTIELLLVLDGGVLADKLDSDFSLLTLNSLVSSMKLLTNNHIVTLVYS